MSNLLRVSARADEVARSLPGDELVPDAQVVMDLGFDLPAPPEEVWPWLAQRSKSETVAPHTRSNEMVSNDPSRPIITEMSTTQGTPDPPASLRATDRPGDTSPFALGLLLRRAHQRASTELVEAIRPLGLELRHFAVLIELTQSGPINQRDLGAAVGMDKAMIVRVVDDLERMGLATRQPVPGDRRVRNVAMTDRGFEVFDAAHVEAVGIASAMVAHLASGEYVELIDLLTRFTYPSVQDGP